MRIDFLSLYPEAFGIDLSDLSVKIAQLKKTGDRISLVSWNTLPIPEGLIEQGDIKKEDQLAKIIREACSKVQGEKLRTKYVVASLPEEKAFLRVIQLPRMKEEEVAGAVRFELENYVPYSPETVYVDTEIISPLKNHLDHLDVLLAVLPKSTVDSYVSLFKKANLVPLVFEIESLACARAVMQKGISPFPILIVDLGATRTSFIVFAGYAIRFTASIQVSSSQCTATLAKHLRVDLKKVEELKMKYGLQDRKSKEGKEVFEALVPPLSDLVDQMKRYLDYYEAHESHQHLSNQDRKIRKIFLTGGGANLKGLEEFLMNELRIEVALGNPWTNILLQPFTKLPPLPLKEALQYTTALGLALRGLPL